MNQAFVRKFFSNQNPVGKTIKNGDTIFQIVGICGDARYSQIRGSIPATFYRAYKQLKETGEMTYELKTAASRGAW